MQYKLNVGVLEPGDIILVGYNDDNARVIQERTKSLYSHAMLYWYGSIIHASDIVITANPSRMLFQEDEPVRILRLKQEHWNPLRIKCLIEYARSFVGTFYDIDALHAMRDGEEVKPNPNRQMCSKFVAQCYEHVFLDLVEDYELCSPEDINRSDLLREVEDPLLETTQEDIDFTKSFDVTKKQFKAIWYFLRLLYRKYPEEDIVSLKQLEVFIEKNPSKGDDVLNLFNRTEYFRLWELEKEHCQYLYNVEDFINKWKDSAVMQAIAVKNDCRRIIEEKRGDILAYKKKIETIGDIAYYRKMIELRENIISTAEEKIAVAEKVLLEKRVVKIKIPTMN